MRPTALKWPFTAILAEFEAHRATETAKLGATHTGIPPEFAPPLRGWLAFPMLPAVTLFPVE